MVMPTHKAQCNSAFYMGVRYINYVKTVIQRYGTKSALWDDCEY